AAAVSDYRPARIAPGKIKKGEGGTTLELVRTPDILRGLGAKKGARVLVGFAAETDGLRENARAKLAAKNLDLIVANDVTQKGAGFGGETNAAVLIDRDGHEEQTTLQTKREVADRILDRVTHLRARTREQALPERR